MIDPSSMQGAQGAGGVAPSGGATTTSTAQVDGAAFRAILEKMEESARALDRTSDDLVDPRALGAAVASARATVEEALSLGGDLLEAFRAAQTRGLDGTESKAAHHTDEEGSGGSH